MSANIKGSEIVETESGRQYHIDLAPGEVAPYVILVGDPARADKVKDFFDDGSIKVSRRNREFVSHTGTYKGIPITVLATGIGTSNIEICLIELSRVIEPELVLRVGSCGALQPYMENGDLVISTGAVRLEDTSLYFVDDNYPSVAHYEVVLALLEASKEYPHHIGLTAAASGFYGAQGREVPGFPVKNPDLQEELAKRNVVNFEMESSTLFTLCSIKGWRSGTICAVYANRPKGTFITADQKPLAEKRVIEAGLEACRILHKMDNLKKEHGTKYYYPSLGLK